MLVVLPLEIGLVHRVMRKACQGPRHGWVRCRGKIYCSYSKHVGLSPGAQYHIYDQRAQLCPSVEEILGLVSIRVKIQS